MRLLIALLGLLLLPACDTIDPSQGTILGALTYQVVEGQTTVLVRNGWVALYDNADPATRIDLQQTDELGVFNFVLPSGEYIIEGSLAETGPFSGRTEPFFVGEGGTARLFLALDVPAPPP